MSGWASKAVQCKDIPARPVLEFLVGLRFRDDGPPLWATWGEGYGFMPTVRDVMPPGTPDKLQRAKMASLIRRGLVDGCDCGCRGDYRITDRGLAWLESHIPTPPPPPGRSS